MAPNVMPPRPDVLPMTAEQRETWRGNIAKAREARDMARRWWEANLKKYAPAPSDDPDQYAEDLNTNRDFTLVERKKADLFFQKPDVTAIPSPLFDGQEHLLDAHTHILNQQLGLNGVNAKAMVHRVLFDVLCPTGTGFTIMGYDSATVPVDQEVPDGEPQMLPGAVMGLSGAQTQPMKTVTVPVPIYEECFWKWFSPFQALVPHDFRSTSWDEAPWLGMEFEMPVRVAKRKGWVPADYQGGPSDGKMYADYGGVSRSATESVAKGVLIWYKSSLYRDDQVHPLHFTYLVFMESVDDPAEHKDSPYQTLAPNGALTPDSLIGNPIHPLTIRTLTDSSIVPSNCTITRATVNEINKTREQFVQFRDANLLRWMYNTDTLPPDALAKMVRSPIGGFIGVPGEAFVGEGAIKELPHGTIPRENPEVNDRLDNDLARSWAIDQNQQGVRTLGDVTATEASIQQGNSNAVLGSERGETLDWFCIGVTKYSTLVQRLWPVEYAAKIVGPQAAAEWDTWRKQVPAAMAFTAMPDSSNRSDLAIDRKRELDQYTFFANDPYVNRPAHLKHIFPKLNLPASLVVEQPPQKGPEPAKPTFAFKGDDLNPLAPQFPIVVSILQQAGITIDPQAIQEAQAGAQNQVLMGQLAPTGASAGGPTNDAQPKHGGKVAQLEGLSKHATDLTGNMQGSGQPAPLGAGGRVQ